MAHTYTTSTSSIHQCLSSTGTDSSTIQQPSYFSNQYFEEQISQDRTAYCVPLSKKRSSPENMKGLLQLTNVRTDFVPGVPAGDTIVSDCPSVSNFSDFPPSELGYANNEKAFSQGRLEKNALNPLECGNFELPAEGAEFDLNSEINQRWIGPFIPPIISISPIFPTIEPSISISTTLGPISNSSNSPIFNRTCATQNFNEQGNTLCGSEFLDSLNHLELRQDGAAFDYKTIQATPFDFSAQNSELEVTQKFGEMKLQNDEEISQPSCNSRTQNQVYPAYIDRKEDQTIEEPKALGKAGVEVEVQNANDNETQKNNASMFTKKPEMSEGPDLSYNTIYFLLTTIYNAKAAFSKGTADPNVVYLQDEDGDTELMICLYNMEKYSDVAWSLLCCSQTPETLSIINKQEQNLLHIAVQFAPEAKQFIRALVVLGCDPTACDVNGQTPLHYAAELGLSDLFRIMLEPFGEGEKAVYHTMFGFPPDTSHSNEGLFNTMNTAGETLLFTAVQHHQVETAIVLLKMGADPCISTYNFKQSPLLQALVNADSDMVRVLLSHEMYSDKQQIINQLQQANVFGQFPLGLRQAWLSNGNKNDLKIIEIAKIIQSAAEDLGIEL